jgi:hypothetical protein
MRLFSLVNSQEILRENVQKVAKCREEIEAAYGKMLKEFEEEKGKLMRKLDEMLAELTILIDKAVSETSLQAYREDYTPSGGLVELLWRNCCENSSEPITTFTYEVGNTDNRLLNPLEIRIQASVYELVNWQYESGGVSLIKELTTTRKQLIKAESLTTKEIDKSKETVGNFEGIYMGLALNKKIACGIMENTDTGANSPIIRAHGREEVPFKGGFMPIQKPSMEFPKIAPPKGIEESGPFVSAKQAKMQKSGPPSGLPLPPPKSCLKLPPKFGLNPPAKAEDFPVIALPEENPDLPVPAKLAEKPKSGSLRGLNLPKQFNPPLPKFRPKFAYKPGLFAPAKAEELPVIDPPKLQEDRLSPPAKEEELPESGSPSSGPKCSQEFGFFAPAEEDKLAEIDPMSLQLPAKGEELPKCGSSLVLKLPKGFLLPSAGKETKSSQTFEGNREEEAELQIEEEVGELGKKEDPADSS